MVRRSANLHLGCDRSSRNLVASPQGLSVMRKTMVYWLIAFLTGGCSSALGPEAETEEGFFASGETNLSYALDIPVVGSAPYPLVVFGHDSGPNTKNEFRASARRLVAHGIATLRFDKRGTGNSDGVYQRGRADFELLTGDLVAAVDLVARDPRVDNSRIGLLGSSQAGWILPMVATRSQAVSFVVILSGPAVTVAQHNFWDAAAADETLSIDHLSTLLEGFDPGPGDFDPRPFIEQMSVPTIWLLGREDRIIPAPRSAEIIREVAQEFNRPFSLILYPDAGHGLRDADSGERIAYWEDLLPWLDETIGSIPAPSGG